MALIEQGKEVQEATLAYRAAARIVRELNGAVDQAENKLERVRNAVQQCIDEYGGRTELIAAINSDQFDATATEMNSVYASIKTLILALDDSRTVPDIPS